MGADELRNRKADFPAEYYDTFFDAEPADFQWPASFAIITAWPPKGVPWSEARIQAEEARLERNLRESGALLCRVTGYSPTANHSEPGWAAAVDIESAAAIGHEFQQDAIYFIETAKLFLVSCKDDRRAYLARFSERLRPRTRRS